MRRTQTVTTKEVAQGLEQQRLAFGRVVRRTQTVTTKEVAQGQTGTRPNDAEASCMTNPDTIQPTAHCGLCHE